MRAIGDHARMQEQVLFQGAGVMVTKQRAVLGGTTYPIRNVSAVSLTKISQTATGVLALLTGAGAIVAAVTLGTMWLIGLGVVLAICGVVLAVSTKWAVTLQTNGGQVNGLVTPDKQLAEQVKAAIETAVVSL